MQTIVRSKGYIAEYSEKFESNKSRNKSMFSFLYVIQYSQRHTMINHCDRRINHLSDTDISFILFNISSIFFVYLKCYLLSLKRHKKVSK